MAPATSGPVTCTSGTSGNMMMPPNMMPPSSTPMPMIGGVMPPPPYSFPGGMWMQPRPPWIPGQPQHGAPVGNSVFGTNSMGENVSNSSAGNALSANAAAQLQGPYNTMPPSAVANAGLPAGSMDPKPNMVREGGKGGEEKDGNPSSYSVMSLISSTVSDTPADHSTTVQVRLIVWTIGWNTSHKKYTYLM